jgi:hypothetical protein
MTTPQVINVLNEWVDSGKRVLAPSCPSGVSGSEVLYATIVVTAPVYISERRIFDIPARAPATQLGMGSVVVVFV